MPTAVVVVLLVLFGAAVGSFCNVIIDRLPFELSEPNRFGDAWDTRPWGEVVGGTSRCSTCGAGIGSIDNVPLVSWFVLRGRCRACGDRIPGFHPLVEAAVPAGWVALWFSGATSLEFLPAYWMVPVGVAISVIDLRTLIVPTRLVWPSLAVAVVLAGLAAIAAGSAGDLLRGLTGLAVLAGPLFVIFMIHPRGMGFGDVRLACFLGWTLGSVAGTERVVDTALIVTLSLAAASVIGILIGVVVLGARGMKAKVPFGPALVVGVFTCIVLVDEMRSLIGA